MSRRIVVAIVLTLSCMYTQAKDIRIVVELTVHDDVSISRVRRLFRDYLDRDGVEILVVGGPTTELMPLRRVDPEMDVSVLATVIRVAPPQFGGRSYIVVVLNFGDRTRTFLLSSAPIDFYPHSMWVVRANLEEAIGSAVDRLNYFLDSVFQP